MKASTRDSISIGAHKRFSQVHVPGEDSATDWKRRIEDNSPATFESLVHPLGGNCKALFESPDELTYLP